MTSALPKDSLVLVTGVNGYIGSHIADQLLLAGYRVRGTTRDLKKVNDLNALWEKKFGSNRIEYTVVPDIFADNAVDEAIKGVSGVVHVASELSFGPNPHKIVTPVINSVNNILNAAANEPSVKRFVYTSSSTAASAAKPNEKFTIDSSTWNEEDISKAWAPPPYESERGWAVYAASKAQGEQAVWKFVKEKKPHFVANAVLPNFAIGKVLVKGQPASTGGWVLDLYDGKKGPFDGFLPPQYFVDVQDIARLHVAALIDEDVKNERLFAYAEPFHVNEILDIIRKLRPDHKVLDDFGDPNQRDLSTVRNERCIELLQKDFGRKGFTSLEESLKNAIESTE